MRQVDHLQRFFGRTITLLQQAPSPIKGIDRDLSMDRGFDRRHKPFYNRLNVGGE